MPVEVTPELRKQILHDHMRVIGAKGGRANKGTEKRRRLTRHAALTRWRRQHPVPKRP